MGNNQPVRHHFVPKFYLARWSPDDVLDVLRRDGGRFSASPTKVAVINGFYDFREEDGEVSKAVEKFLSDEVEGPASAAFAGIDANGGAPAPGSDDREAISAFIAFQMTRTPERRAEMMLAESVRTFLDGRDLDHALMAEYLETIHLGFVPSESEVKGALAFVGFQLHQFEPTTGEFTMRIMYRTSMDLAPRLAEMQWSIAVDRRQRFITADQPVLLWKRPSPRDAFEGVGIHTADQVRLPLDPGKQLVLRRVPRPPVARLTPTEVAQCNRDIAERCHAFVVGSPRQSKILDSLALRARGPVPRFNLGYLFEKDEHGRLVKTDQEILHTWISRD